MYDHDYDAEFMLCHEYSMNMRYYCRTSIDVRRYYYMDIHAEHCFYDFRYMILYSDVWLII